MKARPILPLLLLGLILSAGGAEPVADTGVAVIDPDYAGDVREWWSTHPMNPKAARFQKDIVAPSPTVSLKSGESIMEAVASLPATGGTIRLAAGKYEPFTIIGRSHIHILGPAEGEAIVTGHSYFAVCAEAMDYVTFDALVSNFDNNHYKDKRVWDLYRQPSSDFHLKNLVFDGEGKTVVDFPGPNGIKGLGGALGFKRVRDVLVEDCTFRNYLDAPDIYQHCGLAWGHYGLTNVWLRRCHFTGAARYAVYFDGAHGCGLLDCTIEGKGFKDGGLLFLANHDFTDDLNENGKIDADEEKCAKFLVISGNTFEGNISTPVRITGQNCLIANNIARGRMLELVGVYPTGEIAHRNWAAGELKMRVVDNQMGTCARAVLNVFASAKMKVEDIEATPRDVQCTVTGNAVEKTPAEYLITPPPALKF